MSLATPIRCSSGPTTRAMCGPPNTDIPPDDVVGLDILRPGELPKYHLIPFGDDFFFLEVVLTENTQHIRHLLLSFCSVFASPPLRLSIRCGLAGCLIWLKLFLFFPTAGHLGQILLGCRNIKADSGVGWLPGYSEYPPPQWQIHISVGTLTQNGQ